MTKLKLGPIVEDKPIRLTIDLPASLFADLRLYGELLGADGVPVEPVKLVIPMLERFIATDRIFLGARRSKLATKGK
jgi:hypothetical protein